MKKLAKIAVIVFSAVVLLGFTHDYTAAKERAYKDALAKELCSTLNLYESVTNVIIDNEESPMLISVTSVDPLSYEATEHIEKLIFAAFPGAEIEYAIGK